MNKIAFLYPGQGSQKVGMGKALLDIAPDLFEKYMTRSNTLAALPVTQYCLEGPAESLNQTHIAQPALFTYSLALTDYAQQLDLIPDFVAGHSLGEYTAAVAASVFSFEEGLHLVCQRGKLMHQIQIEKPGAMVAVIGLSVQLLSDLCAQIATNHFVMITACNTPTQFVVSGTESGVQQLIETVRSNNTARAIRLATRGAFHTPLMAPAQSILREMMQEMNWQNARIPLIANVSGNALTNSYLIRQELCDQITSPVQWVSCIQTLLDAGCDTFVELGSSQVLTTMMRAIAPHITCYSADTPEKIIAVAEAVKTKVYA